MVGGQQQMNLRNIYVLAKGSHSYHQFENTIAEKMFNCPKSADSSELTDKLYLTDVSDAKQEAIEFAEWMDIHCVRSGKNMWKHDDDGFKEYFTTKRLYELWRESK